MTDSVRTAPSVSRPNRDGAPARRVLIVGLDGATFDVLKPLMSAGRMPNLKRAVDEGASGTLHSTIPPITPAAWTTFLTGKHPGRHGILDFEGYDVNTGKLWMHSTQSTSKVRTIWRILSDNDYRVGSINVPLTYPPRPLNGCMITGFDTPGPESEFTYPPELKPLVLERWKDPTCGKNWRRQFMGGIDLFRRNVAYMAESFHQGAALTQFCGDKYGWDVLMVVFKLIDNLQHKTWKYLDPRWRDRDPQRTRITEDAFAEADAAVGALLDYARAHDATVLVVSDHGHGSMEGKVHPNTMLRDWGYLVIDRSGVPTGQQIRRTVGRWMGRKSPPVQNGGVLHDFSVDLSRTRACVMHAGNAGFLYINLKGRQPGGIVPPEEYEQLRTELRDRFLAAEAVDPAGHRIRPFPEVHVPEEIYGCTREEQPWMPDLLLIPHLPLAVVRRIRGRKAVRWLPYGKIEGTHRPHGIVIATGPGVKRGATIEMRMADCAPTVLAAMGCPLPSDLDGRVCTAMFEHPPNVRFESADDASAMSAEPAESDEAVYSEAELAKITERLSDLGYLE